MVSNATKKTLISFHPIMRPMKNLQQIIHKYVCVRKFQALTFNIVTYRNFSSNRSNDDTFSLAVDNEK